MTAENVDQLLEGFLEPKPFRVFTVELNTGPRFEVDHPRAMVLRNGVAVFFRRAEGQLCSTMKV